MSTIKSRKQTELKGVVMDVPIIHSLYHLYKILHELLLKFPKSQRFTLGSSLQTELLATIEAVIAAATTSDHLKKQDYLSVASAKLDVLRLLIRLAKDCNCLTNDAYLKVESQLHEVGKMLGGWIKSL